MHAPRDAHWSAVKQVLQSPPRHPQISWHTPTRTGRAALNTRRSTSGYCVYLGSSLISWSCNSSAEAEYRAVANAVVECTWLRQLLSELSCPVDKAIVVFVTTFRLSTSPPTLFIIDALSKSSWMSTSFESRLLSVTFEFFMCRPLSSLRIS